LFFFFQAVDGIRAFHVTGVQTCALPIYGERTSAGGDEQVRALGRHPSVRGEVEAALAVAHATREERGDTRIGRHDARDRAIAERSAERRVGNGCGSTGALIVEFTL